MLRMLLAAALLPAVLLSGALAAPSPEAPLAPKGPPPNIRLIKMDDKGDLVNEVTVTVTQYVPVVRQVEVEVNGMKVTRNVVEKVPVMKMERRVEVFSGKGLKASTADGKAVDARALAARLARPTLVVISSDNQPVDPAYLRLLAKDTLVLVPAPTPPIEPRKER